MIVNPEKFQAIAVKKNAKMKDSYPLNINDLTINSKNSVKLLGIEIDSKLPFGQHISTLYNKASNQLNAIGKIQKFMGFKEKEKEVLLNSFVYSNFNYFPLVCSSKSLYKIERIKERVIRLLHSDFIIEYAEIFKKSGKATMEIKRLQCLALETFKTVNNLNPYYMNEILSKITNLTHRPLDINFHLNNTTKYGNNSLRNLGSHIWNSLPSEINEETEYEKFKNYMNN